MCADRPIIAAEVPPRAKVTSLPEPFAARAVGRAKRPLGDLFGLKSFGVNLTTLAPGAISALFHTHTVQDEFVYIVYGTPLLRWGEDEHRLGPGMAVGFPAGGAAHHLVNDSEAEVVYLEVGDRVPGDRGVYPEDDLAARQTPEGAWIFTHKDGTPY
ncbi:MAG: cupin domain-containing protein [Rhodospirillaceae bacterium]|nr:cupin domain-containing protein [Rhodospirillaceae bacterium]